jgi:tRNA(adenine34) deaminase
MGIKDTNAGVPMMGGLHQQGVAMRGPRTDGVDRAMMTRCIALSVQSGEDGEYPYGVVIRRAGDVVTESTNRVAHERDVTRHAEVVAISQAQKVLGATSLDDCTIYVNAEPCAYCSYAIRESRIGRVIYGLRSPHMGGVSKWNVLPDEDLSNTMPEVFAPPPEIIAGYMSHEVEQTLLKWDPLVWGVVKRRGLFVAGPVETVPGRASHPPLRRSRERVMSFLRRVLFDRFGRSP